MQYAPEYEIAATGTYARALDLLRAGIEKAKTDPSWSAAIEQRGGDYSSLPPAVVMDVDETVLDNSPVQARQVLSDQPDFNAKAWGEWVALKRATGVPGALEFVREARKLARVIFVTNRTADEEPATLENLAALGVPTDASDVLTLGEAGPDGTKWVSDKTARRAFVASKYRILLLVGDDLGDFIAVGGKGLAERRAAAQELHAYWADRWVALPNPTYGSWERATFDRALPDAERLDQKRKLLKAF
jgi:acid phosphatase